MKPSVRVVLLLALRLVAGAPLDALGQSHASSSNAPVPRGVEVVVVGSEERLRWLEELLGRNPAPGAAVRFSRLDSFDERAVLTPGEKPNLALRCWLDLRDARRARIVLRSKDGDRFLFRELEMSGAWSEMDRQELGHVLGLSWSALLDDAEVGLSRADAEMALRGPKLTTGAAPATKPPKAATNTAPSPPSPAPTPALELGALYAVSAFAAELPLTQGPGVALLIHAGDSSPRPGLWFSAQYRFPQTKRTEVIGVELEGFALRSGLELSWPLMPSRSWPRTLFLRGGAGVDLAHVSPEKALGEVQPALSPARWSAAPTVSGALGTTLRLGASADLGAALTLDYLPITTLYEVEVDGVRATVISPWRLRPGALLELRLH